VQAAMGAEFENKKKAVRICDVRFMIFDLLVRCDGVFRKQGQQQAELWDSGRNGNGAA
jgi:hypothetical protein